MWNIWILKFIVSTLHMLWFNHNMCNVGTMNLNRAHAWMFVHYYQLSVKSNLSPEYNLTLPTYPYTSIFIYLCYNQLNNAQAIIYNDWRTFLWILLYVTIKAHRPIVYFFHWIKSEDVNTVHTLMFYVGLTEMFFKLLYLSPLRLNGECLSWIKAILIVNF